MGPAPAREKAQPVEGFRSKDQKLFTVSSSDNKLHEWNLITGRQIMKPLKMPPAARVGAASPDGRLVVANGL